MMKQILIALIVIFSLSIQAQDQIILPFNSIWKYLDDGSSQGPIWKQSNFDDTSWASGPGILGYGSSDVSTLLSFGSDPDDKHITTYFRHRVNLDDVSQFRNFLLRLRKDDAAVVYVNGQEVMRSNFNPGTITFSKEAYSSISSEEEEIIWEDLISTSFFQNGENIVAVEIHQVDGESSDILFDLEILGLDSIPAIYRQPYLQKSTASGITIKWKTDIATDSKLWFGETMDDLSNVLESSAMTMNHEIDITGLNPDSKYFYKVGNSMTEFAGGTDDFFFHTNPVIGTKKPTRIWVTGDAGTGKDEQIKVKNSYLNYIGNNGKSDLWLMLGDNAYEHGRESDYHMGLFTKYPEILRNTVSFPVTGNHDLLDADAATQVGTYYDIFALPKNGESGGVASGTESYFSFDYGNIHCIALETYDVPIDSTGQMATWLKNDLENTTADWLILYWHFPPYSKVSHDTDDPGDFSGRSTRVRRFINPIIEKYGVDLVLSGHSHGYERSYLLNGHYGVSNTLTEEMIVDGSSGNIDDQNPYQKPLGLEGNKGTVYAVCGNAGKLSSLVDGESEHPAMFTTNLETAGSMIIDVSGDTMAVQYLNENGIIRDYFHIIKSNIPSSVIESNTSLDFKLFPNPAKDFLNITLATEEVLENVQLEFYAVDGKLIKTETFENLTSRYINETINTADFLPGIYTVKLISNNSHLISKPLIVN